MNNEIAFAEFMTKDKWFIFCSHEEGSWPSWWWGTMGQRPGVTRCQWYIFVWISALRNPNGGHTLGKCAQIVIQWYFEGCIRNNIRPDPPNKQLCSMLSTIQILYTLTNHLWSDGSQLSCISKSKKASVPRAPPPPPQTDNYPAPPSPGTKTNIIASISGSHQCSLKWEWETFRGRARAKALP